MARYRLALCTSGVQFNRNTLEKLPPSLKVWKIKIYSGGHIVLSHHQRSLRDNFSLSSGKGPRRPHNTKRREKFKIRQEEEYKKCPKIDTQNNPLRIGRFYSFVYTIRTYVYIQRYGCICTHSCTGGLAPSLSVIVGYLFLSIGEKSCCPPYIFPCSMEMSKRNMSTTFLFIPIVRHTSTQ